MCHSYREYVSGTVNVPLFKAFFAGNLSVEMLDAMNCTEAVQDALDWQKATNFSLDAVEHLNLSQYLNVSRYGNESALYHHIEAVVAEYGEYEEHIYVEPADNVSADSFSTTLSNEQLLVERMCIDEISGKLLFEEKGIDPDSLYLMWSYIIVICVVLRVAAVAVVAIKEYRGISWMRKHIRNRLC